MLYYGCMKVYSLYTIYGDVSINNMGMLYIKTSPCCYTIEMLLLFS